MDYLKQDDAKNISFDKSLTSNFWGVENQYSDSFSYMEDAILEIQYRLNSRINLNGKL